MMNARDPEWEFQGIPIARIQPHLGSFMERHLKPGWPVGITRRGELIGFLVHPADFDIKEVHTR